MKANHQKTLVLVVCAATAIFAQESDQGAAKTPEPQASESSPGQRSRLRRLLGMPGQALGAVAAAPGNVFRHRRISPIFEKRKIGEFSIGPTFSLSHRYSDNIFGIDRSETEDYVTTLAPGIKAEIPFGEGNSLFAQYELQIVRPRNYDAELSTENHFLAVETELKLSDGLTLGLADSVSRQAVPADDREDRPDQFYYNDASATLAWEIGERVSAEAALAHEVMRFRQHESRIDDFHAPRAQATVLYQLSENGAFLVGYAYKHMFNDNDTNLNDEPEDTDNDNHTISIGLDFGEGLPVSGRVQAGAGRKNFGDRREEDVHTLVFAADLTWEASEKLSIAFGASRSIEETTLSAANDNSGRSFITNTLEAGLEYDLGSDWFLLAGASITKDRYLQRGEFDHHRVDWLPSVRVGFAYRPVEWVSTELTYEHYDNHSNADGENWRENTAIFSLSVGF